MPKILRWQFRRVRLREVKPGECFCFSHVEDFALADSKRKENPMWLVYVRTGAPIPKDEGNPEVCQVSWQVVEEGEE